MTLKDDMMNKRMNIKNMFYGKGLFTSLVLVGLMHATVAKEISIKLSNASLQSATKAIADQTGLQFTIIPSKEPFDKINLNIRKIQPNDAVRYVCECAGAWAELDSNGVYTIRKGNPPQIDWNANEPLITRKIKCNNLSSKEIYETLTDVSKQIQKQEVSRQNEPSKDGYKETEVILNKSNQHVDRSSDLQGSEVSEGMATSKQMIPSDPLGAQKNVPIPGLPGQSGSFPPGYMDSRHQGIPQARNVGPLSPGTGLVPEGIDYLSYSPQDNQLIVRGRADAIEKLEQTVEVLDVAPKQVVVKVEFVETKLDDELGYGVDWYAANDNSTSNSQKSSDKGSVTQATELIDTTVNSIVDSVKEFVDTPKKLVYSIAKGMDAVQLRAKLKSGNTRVVDAPVLRTLNNQPASIALSEKVGFKLKSDAYPNQATGNVSTEKFDEKESKRTLFINPRINSDGTITLFMKPVISKFVDGNKFTDSTSYTIQEQQIDIVTKVNDGQTIVIGGMKNRVRNTSKSKVPILGDIPILGKLFSSTHYKDEDRDLLIFITVNIVGPND